MGFPLKLLLCFTCWKVTPSSDDDLRRADIILALSFGFRKNQPGTSNEALAEIVADIHRHYSLPIIIQQEIANCLLDIPKAGVIQKHRVDRKYLDTFEALSQSLEICRKQNWIKTIIIAHPDHMFRVAQTAEKLGFKVYIADTSSVPYDHKSLQPWTRNRTKFIPREIIARIIYLLHGWI